MRIDLPYRNGKIGLDLPDSTEVIEPNNKETDDSPRDLVRQALERPLDSPGLDQFLDGAKGLLVIVNDGTRPTPTSVVLDVIGDGLERVARGSSSPRRPSGPEQRMSIASSSARTMALRGEDRCTCRAPERVARLLRNHEGRYPSMAQQASSGGGQNPGHRLGGTALFRRIYRRRKASFREWPAMRQSRRTINWRFSPKPIPSPSTKIRCTAIWKTR